MVSNRAPGEMPPSGFIRVSWQGGEALIPDLVTVALHRVAFRRQLERIALARWGEPVLYNRNNSEFLSLQAWVGAPGRRGTSQELSNILRRADRLLLLGGPGSGKTTALERLAWEFCAGSEPIIPLWLPLINYTGQKLVDWVRESLQSTELLGLKNQRTLEAFLAQSPARCLFLVDGLDEAPIELQDRLMSELYDNLRLYPRHPVIITGRIADERWWTLREAMTQVAILQPFEPSAVQRYLTAYLGQKGTAFYQQLNNRMQVMAQSPLGLKLLTDVAAEGIVPQNQGDLYAQWVARQARTETNRKMDSQLPLNWKQQALADLAYHLTQTQRRACSHEEAETVIANRHGVERARDLLGACLRQKLLEKINLIHFAPHPALQDYFTAQALHERWNGSKLELPEGKRWEEPLIQLTGLMKNPERLISGLLNENPWAAWWCIEESRSINPAIRTGAMDKMRTALPTLTKLRSERALPFLWLAGAQAEESTAKDRLPQTGKLLWWGDVAPELWPVLSLEEKQRVISVLATSPTPQTIKRLFWIAGDENSDVSQAAVQTLIKLGPAIRPQALSLARYSDPGGLAYLSALIGIPVVWVPPGPFLMGSSKKDKSAGNDEMPQHVLTLPGYWIGQGPVTVNQFWNFVAHTGYSWPYIKEQLGPEYPVTHVTWQEAALYSSWLGAHTGFLISLPSEMEWEKAARGTDGRAYPWGQHLPDPTRCNFHNQVGHATPAGRYSPQGDSPYGCMDMAGNVWEWIRTPDQAYPCEEDSWQPAFVAGDIRLVRGGSFATMGRTLRCANRGRERPEHRSKTLGFRIVIKDNPS